MIAEEIKSDSFSDLCAAKVNIYNNKTRKHFNASSRKDFRQAQRYEFKLFCIFN